MYRIAVFKRLIEPFQNDDRNPFGTYIAVCRGVAKLASAIWRKRSGIQIGNGK